jgi:hypothetical protein
MAVDRPRRPSPGTMAIAGILLLAGLIGQGWAAIVTFADPALSRPTNNAWEQLIDQAVGVGLPTRFTRFIEPGFVTIEFEDLRAFAAEYHPAEHRMVLNRALSFNAAAGALKALSALPHRDVGTLYHELFHAYFDFLRSHPDRAAADPYASRLLNFAETVRGCRYQTVQITPVPQRKTVIETRFLTEGESWEALNETWALFVGWAIWSRLELSGSPRAPQPQDFARWIKRLAKADRDGDLVGYYEPEDLTERAVTRKRYLAPSHRISPEEAQILLETVLEFAPDQAARAAKAMQSPPERCSGGP